MRRRDIVLVVGFAVGGVLAVKTRAIPGGGSLLTVLFDIAPDLVTLTEDFIVLIADPAIGFEAGLDAGNRDQGGIGTAIILAQGVTALALRLRSTLPRAGDRAEIEADIVGGFGVDLGLGDASSVFANLGDTAGQTKQHHGSHEPVADSLHLFVYSRWYARCGSIFVAVHSDGLVPSGVMLQDCTVWVTARALVK